MCLAYTYTRPKCADVKRDRGVGMRRVTDGPAAVSQGGPDLCTVPAWSQKESLLARDPPIRWGYAPLGDGARLNGGTEPWRERHMKLIGGGTEPTAAEVPPHVKTHEQNTLREILATWVRTRDLEIYSLTLLPAELWRAKSGSPVTAIIPAWLPGSEGGQAGGRSFGDGGWGGP